MLLKGLIKTSLNGLRANKSRSALTILGIVIGITAIILVVSLGQNARQAILGELGGLGAESVVVQPGREADGPTAFAEVFLADSLKERELEAILRPGNVPDLLDASPEIFVVASAAYKGETFKPTVLGFDADYLAAGFKLELAEGVLFDDADTRAKARVALIGDKTKRELFGEESALGERIELKGQKFRVIGIFKPRGQVVFFNVDDLVLVPWTSAQAFLTGQKHFQQINAKAKSATVVNRMVGDIELTLRELHNITDPEKDDFHVETQQGLVEQIGSIINVFSAFLTMVVAISLVVGGIGIMNIMLVSVTERTREIGLRKAVGATNTDILRQFLLEAVFLTALGGLIGIVFGTLLAFGVSFILSVALGTPWSFSFPLQGALIGFLVSAGVGVVFGLYPARRAAKLSPIEALRYE